MGSLRLGSLLAAVAVGCAGPPPAPRAHDWSTNVAAFEREIQDLQAALGIPGLAYVIVEEGRPIASRGFGSAQGSTAAPFTPATALRIASVTKALTAVVAMQLAEEGRLDLEAPARRYVPTLAVPEGVLVRHLLTHTSEGIPGEECVCGTTRYSRLGPVIEAITGQGFEAALRERVLERAGMRSHPSPDLGAHAGLVSTVDDMAAYLAALDRGRLLSAASLERLATPSRSAAGRPLPVSLGWFAQEVQGLRVTWSFGQDDPDHSGALLVRLPDHRLSLFVLANANVLSDPFRLLMGDVSKTPFAMSFLRLFAFSDPGTPLARPERDLAHLGEALADVERGTRYRFRDELIGWALIDLWLDRGPQARQKLDFAAARHGAAREPDAVLHFAALRLPDPADKEAAVRAGVRLLAEHPNNRWMLLAQAYLLEQLDRGEPSSACFRRILELPNQEPDHLNRLFRAWSWMGLARSSASRDPAEARRFLQDIIDSGVKGEMLEDARHLLEQLSVPPPAQ